MNKLLFIFLLFISSVYALDFKVASYNVENLFDQQNNGTEYKEYIPNKHKWNLTAYKTKLQNTSKVIKELDADIIALQEIESLQALKDLKSKLSIYSYHKFTKKRKSAIGLGFLSKYPIISYKNVIVDKYNQRERDILRITVRIENKKLIIYNNHWRSKRAKESKRVRYAKALIKDIKTLSKDEDYIILGDLNSNYDEFLSFKYDKNLNDTFGITGINQVLNTSLNGNILRLNEFLKINKLAHYNLWLELKGNKRFSSKYRSHNNTPDNIILSKSLFDSENISYKQNSFQVFKPSYVYKNNKIKRWNTHKNSGYSDHLAIYAGFSTSKQIQKVTLKKEIKKDDISYLYTIDTLNKNVLLKNTIVIYKYKNNAIIKQKNNRAVLVYKSANSLKLRNIYDIEVSKIETYFNLKEIKEISNIKYIKSVKSNISDFYMDANTIDIFDEKYQNEIIKNLKGIYKKGYLNFKYNYKNKKIKLYFNKVLKKPKDNLTITILSGHLSKYKSQTQITIHKITDYK
ncbi:MAG TPA: endonuclease/exonuclease/phosphatase family protein [Arcobacter sp.]|nr:endonuclease/exonuclease/phosphatase family protein [Arcobacter sp.]